MKTLICVAVSLALAAGGRLAADDTKGKPKGPDTAALTSAVDGIIQALPKEGDAVKRGQVLVQLDDRKARLELEAARARVKAALADREANEALFKEAEARFKRADALFARGVLPADELQSALLTKNKYATEVVAAKARCTLAELTEQVAALTVEQHQLRSPVDGVILRINRVLGDGVRAYDAVLVIQIKAP